MLTVALSAHRGIGLAPSGQLAMYPLPVVLFYAPMAFPAGFGNIKMVDGRFGIARTQYAMSGSPSGMTVITGGGKIDTAHCRFAMHAVFIKFNRFLKKDLVLLDNIQILVTAPTSCGQIHRIDLGVSFRRRQDIMAAMAISTSGNILTSWDA